MGWAGLWSRRASGADAEAASAGFVSVRAGWGRAAIAWSRRASAALADLVYPPACIGCGTMTGRHGAVCAACWQGLAFIEKPFCPVLGTPFSHDMGDGIISAEAIANPPSFDRARAAVLYDDLARQIVTGLKYRDRTDLALTMAQWMVRPGGEALSACDAILAVPLHRWRLVSRKFNQSAELARALAALSGRPLLANAIERRRATRPQVGLDASQRRANVRGAFAVRKESLPDIFGRRLVLVDDVYTTGATVSAAAAALKKAGAADVTVLTFARVRAGHI